MIDWLWVQWVCYGARRTACVWRGHRPVERKGWSLICGLSPEPQADVHHFWSRRETRNYVICAHCGDTLASAQLQLSDTREPLDL